MRHARIIKNDVGATRRARREWQARRGPRHIVLPPTPTPPAPVEDEGFFTLSGATSQAIVQGAQVGLNFVPVVGPALAALVGPIAGLFDRSQQRAEETSRDVWRNAANDVLNALRDNAAQIVLTGQATPAALEAQARAVVAEYYSQINSLTKGSVRQSAENFRSDFEDRIRAIRTAADNAEASAPAPVVQPSQPGASQPGTVTQPADTGEDFTGYYVAAGAVGLLMLVLLLRK